MKYLFFDTEMAVCHKFNCVICEFGYVIVDEKFNVFSKDNIIINPSIPYREWDKFAKQNILTRKVSDYEKEATFLMVYDDIVKLFKDVDIVFGHTLEGDAKAINDECIRYELKAINYDFYDTNKMYNILFDSKNNESLESLLKIFDVSVEGELHDAEADAFNTMLVLKAMVERLQKPLKEILETCESIKDRTENFVIKSRQSKKKRREESNKKIMHVGESESSSLGSRFADLFAELEKELED